MQRLLNKFLLKLFQSYSCVITSNNFENLEIPLRTSMTFITQTKKLRSTLEGCSYKKVLLNICSKFIGEHPHRSCDFNKVAKQLY